MVEKNGKKCFVKKIGPKKIGPKKIGPKNLLDKYTFEIKWVKKTHNSQKRNPKRFNITIF